MEKYVIFIELAIKERTILPTLKVKNVQIGFIYYYPHNLHGKNCSFDVSKKKSINI
jgi:hypothetical protein